MSGIPFLKPVDCDSCRVKVERAEIDSLRIGDPVAGFWTTAALGALAGLVALCYLGGCDTGGT